MSMLNLWGRKWEWSFRSHATPSLNFVVVAPYIDIDVPNLLIKHLKKKVDHKENNKQRILIVAVLKHSR